MTDQLALFIAGLGNMLGAAALVLTPTPGTTLVMSAIGLCGAIGTAALLRAAVMK